MEVCAGERRRRPAVACRQQPGGVRTAAAVLVLFAASRRQHGLQVSARAGGATTTPLRLRPWVSVDPLPDTLLGGVLESFAAPTARPPRALMQHTAGVSSSSTAAAAAAGRRRMLRPALLNSDDVPADAPGLPTGAATTAWATAFVVPSARGAQVPRSFLGISHEWTDVEELGQEGSYQRLIGDLSAYGGGPLSVRVGGGSTDLQRKVPPPAAWDALRRLHAATGARYVLGLNFHAANASLAAAQQAAARAALPAGAVASFEVGNEPNYYEDRTPSGADQYISCCFVNEWGAFVRALGCPQKVSASCVRGQFAGPAWGHISMSTASLDWFLRLNSEWMNLVTVHWYKATKETRPTVESLLDEAPQQVDMASLRALVAAARRWGLPLRVAEMNTISNSGARGVSNSLAAALWTLDGMLEVAKAGAVGVNLHWGNGGALYAAVLRQPQGASIVKPAYYAYLLFQMAIGGGASFVPADVQATPNARFKVWALADDASGALRVVVVNKSPGEAGGVVVRLPAGDAAGYARVGKLLRLAGPRGLAEEWNVKLGNVTYGIGGAPFGTPAGEAILQVTEEVSHDAGDGAGARAYGAAYVVAVPPGSAALLTIPRA